MTNHPGLSLPPYHWRCRTQTIAYFVDNTSDISELQDIDKLKEIHNLKSIKEIIEHNKQKEFLNFTNKFNIINQGGFKLDVQRDKKGKTKATQSTQNLLELDRKELYTKIRFIQRLEEHTYRSSCFEQDFKEHTKLLKIDKNKLGAKEEYIKKAHDFKKEAIEKGFLGIRIYKNGEFQVTYFAEDGMSVFGKNGEIVLTAAYTLDENRNKEVNRNVYIKTVLNYIIIRRK